MPQPSLGETLVKIAMGNRGAQRVLRATELQGPQQSFVTHNRVLERATGNDLSTRVSPLVGNQHSQNVVAPFPAQATTPQSQALAKKIQERVRTQGPLQTSTRRFGYLADPNMSQSHWTQANKVRHIQDAFRLEAPPQMSLQERLKAFKSRLWDQRDGAGIRPAFSELNPRQQEAVRRSVGSNLQDGLIRPPEQWDAVAMSGRHAGNRQVLKLPVSDWQNQQVATPGMQGRGYNPLNVVHRGGNPFYEHKPNAQVWATGLPGMAQHYMRSPAPFSWQQGSSGDAIASYRLNQVHPFRRGPYTRQVGFNPRTEASFEHPFYGQLSRDQWLKGGFVLPHTESNFMGHRTFYKNPFPADLSPHHEMVIDHGALPTDPRHMSVERMLPSSRHFFGTERGERRVVGDAPAHINMQQVKGRGWRPLAGDFGAPQPGEFGYGHSP